MSAAAWTPQRGAWSTWDAWRVGVIERYHDSPLGWTHDDGPYHPTSEAYDNGMNYAESLRNGERSPEWRTA
jgi:hypothetical protein